MTDIDLTEAVEEAAKSIMSEYEDGLPSWRDLDSQGQTWYRGIAKGALEAALSLILAQVEARVKPSREDAARALSVTDVHHPDLCDCGDFDAAQWCDGLEQQIDAVLALFNGKTEQEVRDEIAAEIEARSNTNIELADRFGGYHQGIRSALQEAAKIARGGEQND